MKIISKQKGNTLVLQLLCMILGKIREASRTWIYFLNAGSDDFYAGGGSATDGAGTRLTIIKLIL